MVHDDMHWNIQLNFIVFQMSKGHASSQMPLTITLMLSEIIYSSYNHFTQVKIKKMQCRWMKRVGKRKEKKEWKLRVKKKITTDLMSRSVCVCKPSSHNCNKSNGAT